MIQLHSLQTLDSKTRAREGEGEVYTEPLFGDGDAIHPQCWYVDVINETYLGASA